MFYCQFSAKLVETMLPKPSFFPFFNDIWFKKKMPLLLCNHSHSLWLHFSPTLAAGAVDYVTIIELVDEINGSSYWGLIEQNI